jgi:hypothetical protein
MARVGFRPASLESRSGIGLVLGGAGPCRGILGLCMALSVGSTLLGPLGDAEARESPWHLQMGFGTDFPLHIGGQACLEMPAGVQISTSFGYLLSAYVEVVNAIAQGFDAYEQETADLVLASWRDALVWRLHVGWRPLSDLGLYVEAGYGLVTLGSLVAGGDLVTVLEDDVRDLLDEEALRYERYDLASTLHMLDLEVGWRWVFDNGWYVRVALGFAATLAGQTVIGPAEQRSESGQDAMIAAGVKTHLNAIYRDHVHTPVISLSTGIRFF